MASTKGTMNLPGAMSPSADYWNRMMIPARTLGLAPGTGSKAAGQQLPGTSHQAGDKGVNWWHPDSPQFWLLLFAGGALVGVSGLSFRFRAGPAKAGAAVGKS